MAKISVPWRGVIELVSEWDVGKTTAALQVVSLKAKDPYAKTVFVDDDEKGQGTVEQLEASGIKFENGNGYYNLGALRGKAKKAARVPTPDEYLDQVIYPVIDEISRGKHDVVIWDTWASVYTALRGHVERNQYKYKEVVTFKGTSPMIQGQISKVARTLEKDLIDSLKASCSILLLTHHLKDNYVQNVVAGKIPESSRTFQEVCNMRIWLRRNPISKVPIILFLKRPQMPVFDEKKGLHYPNVVPPKITPNGNENSIWDAMQRYVADPIESRALNPDETPTVEEFAILNNTLTEDQRRFVTEMLKYSKQDEEAGQEVAGILTGTPTLENQLDEEFPPVPDSGAKLVAQCMTKWGMSVVQINEVTGIGMGKIMDLNSEELEEAWKKLLKANQK